MCKTAAAASLLLLLEDDELSLAAALVDLLEVRRSATPPAGGEAAALPPAVVRLQAAMQREEVVLQLVLIRALRTSRTLHPAVHLLHVRQCIELPDVEVGAAGECAVVGHVLEPENVQHVHVVLHRRLRVLLLADGTGQLGGVGGLEEGGRGEEAVGDRPEGGFAGLG
ncbi:hypothetical protein TYRP_008981 [Tyrophagus putrescentiae]|nr:hypothetical protein TYRP_008981 [Tyrophagus putrescentiae]